MTKLSWTDLALHQFEAGVDRGVLYPLTGPGVVWNGLINIEDRTEGVESTFFYYEGEKFVHKLDRGQFEATIEAYTYPDEFDEDLSFGMSYRTLIGDAVKGLDRGYKLHLVYNALVSPTQSAYSSLSDQSDNTTFSWDVATKPQLITGSLPSAHLVIDSRLVHAETLQAVEEVLYGTDGVNPRLPTADEIIEIFQAGAILKITDHGDGTWSADGPEEAIRMLDGSTFEIEWPSARYLDDVSYTIESL